jgi:hypothetical protein
MSSTSSASAIGSGGGTLRDAQGHGRISKILFQGLNVVELLEIERRSAAKISNLRFNIAQNGVVVGSGTAGGRGAEAGGV